MTWHRNGQPIAGGGRFLLDCGTRGTFSLVIHAVHEEDKGKYTCEATNGSGARQVTVELTVEGESQEVKALGRNEPSVSPRPAAPASALSWERDAQEKASPFRNSGPVSLMGAMWSLEQGRHPRRQCQTTHHLPFCSSLPLASSHTETGTSLLIMALQSASRSCLALQTLLLPLLTLLAPLWSHWPSACP